MRVQERTIEILRTIEAFQCMTNDQIAKRFDMNIKVCQRKTKELVTEQYLGEPILLPTFDAGKSPHLHYLGEEGEKLLNVKASKPKPGWQLSHQRKNTDLMIHVFLCAKQAGMECELLPEHLIRSRNDQSIIPDGSFRLKKDNRTMLGMLENCGGSESLQSALHHDDLETKFLRYKAMFEEDAIQFYEQQFGCEFLRFRVFFVANTPQRLSAIRTLVQQLDPHGFIWLTAYRQFMNEGIFGRIWHTAFSGKPVGLI